MAASESLHIVRSRVCERIAEAERRSARTGAVDIGRRMAAIRAMAAGHGLAAPALRPR